MNKLSLDEKHDKPHGVINEEPNEVQDEEIHTMKWSMKEDLVLVSHNEIKRREANSLAIIYSPVL